MNSRKIIFKRERAIERERQRTPKKIPSSNLNIELKLNNSILLTRNPSSPAFFFISSSFPSSNHFKCVYIWVFFSSHFFLLHLMIGMILFFLFHDFSVSSSSIYKCAYYILGLNMRVCAHERKHMPSAHIK